MSGICRALLGYLLLLASACSSGPASVGGSDVEASLDVVSDARLVDVAEGDHGSEDSDILAAPELSDTPMGDPDASDLEAEPEMDLPVMQDGEQDSADLASADASPETSADAAPDTPPDVAPDIPPDVGLDCSALLVCDDFEADTPGAPPSDTRWEVVMPNCSGTGTVSVDAEVSSSGSQSVRVDGRGGYCNHVFLSPTQSIESISDDLWVRFRVRFGSELAWDHVTFVAMRDATDERDVRMGGQSQILMWNKELDDATLPELSPTGIAASLVPTPGAWHCIEFHVVGAAGTLDTYVDSERIEGLSADGAPTRALDEQWYRRPWSPSLVEARFGWESYGGAEMTLWFDDVAIDRNRVGCE